MVSLDNVEFSGFKDVDEPAMANLKVALGSYLKRFSEICPTADKLSLTMKIVHGLGKDKGNRVYVDAFCTGHVHQPPASCMAPIGSYLA